MDSYFSGFSVAVLGLNIIYLHAWIHLLHYLGTALKFCISEVFNYSVVMGSAILLMLHAI